MAVWPSEKATGESRAESREHSGGAPLQVGEEAGNGKRPGMGAEGLLTTTGCRAWPDTPHALNTTSFLCQASLWQRTLRCQ